MSQSNDPRPVVDRSTACGDFVVVGSNYYVLIRRAVYSNFEVLNVLVLVARDLFLVSSHLNEQRSHCAQALLILARYSADVSLEGLACRIKRNGLLSEHRRHEGQ